MQNKFLQSTKDILEKNLKILEKPFCDKKVVLVYDEDSKLSKILGESYVENLKKYNDINTEIIVFGEIKKEELKEKLMTLETDSTVILVQSTNFRLDDFRLRLNLKNQGVGAIEHNHLGYIKDSEIENYADAIKYRTPFYNKLSANLKEKCDKSDIMIIKSKNGDELILTGGFEDMKQNTGDFGGRIRAGSFPIGENFTEIKNFDNCNGKVSIRAYPNLTFEVMFPEVFSLEIKESRIVGYSENTPKEFIEILDKIKSGENGECFVRELGFGLNPGITWDRNLNDVNAFERIMGFHMSLGKKHQIYRKKFHRKVTQRYHIDIFLDTDYIELDGEKIFKNEKFL